MFRYFKFRLNDVVRFVENDSHTYRIVGYRLERSFYPQAEQTSIVYELVRDFDGYRRDAEEEEIVKAEEMNENIVMYGRDLWGYLKPFKIQVLKSEENKSSNHPLDKLKYIDELLDAYNDYKRLAKVFDDEKYEKQAADILERLENATLFISEAN